MVHRRGTTLTYHYLHYKAPCFVYITPSEVLRSYHTLGTPSSPPSKQFDLFYHTLGTPCLLHPQVNKEDFKAIPIHVEDESCIPEVVRNKKYNRHMDVLPNPRTRVLRPHLSILFLFILDLNTPFCSYSS